MTTDELRSRFLEFFREKGHAVIPSASVIPDNDPTVLFTTAGMHPLVPYLLGERHAAGKRLANAQKCVRTGDIDEVGDNRHLTFFEMLGNWSLGDYFKKESIPWSFEFLTSPRWLNVDPARIYVTVFEGDADAPHDTESTLLWQDVYRTRGIDAKPSERIFAYPKSKNWWGPAGASGPCGPDTEIFYDTGTPHNPAFGPECHPNCDCGRFVEIWNNVFMEFNKTPDGRFEPLAQRNVDTGMGLERTLVALGRLQTVFQIDTFQSLLSTIGALSNKPYGNREEDDKAMRVIADHVRTAAFILGDPHAVAPSNVDQGYILRRLIRRAVRYGRQLGITGSFTAKIAEDVVRLFGKAHPELQRNAERITAELNAEEDKFSRTLQNGLREAERVGREIGGRTEIPGETAFYLYESFGFPKELTEEVLGRKVDDGSWNVALKAHQDRSRQGAEKRFKGGLADHSWTSTRYHTATHLLHKALRDVLGTSVEQRGSNITADRMRFDFSHQRKMTAEEIKKTEDLVNEVIARDLPVHYEEMTVEEAKARGAIGLFEDRYGDRIKVYVVGDFSSEICGGPHVGHTAQIGRFKIVKEEASSAGIRRIKAVLENVGPDGGDVSPDKSNGYEEIAPIFIAGRGRDGTGIGASSVVDWAKTLPLGATVLDLGCGPGRPISQVFIERGFNVYGVDASPRMVAAFRANFPGIPVECAAVEDSNFFGRQFDAVVSWGLFFLLRAEVQRQLITKIAAVLPSGCRFLFTAPTQICSWNDAMTDQLSISLGYDAYRGALEAEGLRLVGTHEDEGGNHYYFAQKL